MNTLFDVNENSGTTMTEKMIWGFKKEYTVEKTVLGKYEVPNTFKVGINPPDTEWKSLQFPAGTTREEMGNYQVLFDGKMRAIKEIAISWEIGVPMKFVTQVPAWVEDISAIGRYSINYGGIYIKSEQFCLDSLFRKDAKEVMNTVFRKDAIRGNIRISTKGVVVFTVAQDGEYSFVAIKSKVSGRGPSEFVFGNWNVFCNGYHIQISKYITGKKRI